MSIEDIRASLEDDVINARDAVIDACMEMHVLELRYLEQVIAAKTKGNFGHQYEWIQRAATSVEQCRRSVSDATAVFAHLSERLRKMPQPAGAPKIAKKRKKK